MHKIQVKQFIDAAHKLTDSKQLLTKKCAGLHGHTYHVIVEVEGGLNGAEMVVDFKAIKDIINELDHKYINDVFNKSYDNHEPTAEAIAMFYYHRIKKKLKVTKIKVKVCEGYKGPESSNYVQYPA